MGVLFFSFLSFFSLDFSFLAVLVERCESLSDGEACGVGGLELSGTIFSFAGDVKASADTARAGGAGPRRVESLLCKTGAISEFARGGGGESDRRECFRSDISNCIVVKVTRKAN